MSWGLSIKPLDFPSCSKNIRDPEWNLSFLITQPQRTWSFFVGLGTISMLANHLVVLEFRGRNKNCEEWEKGGTRALDSYPSLRLYHRSRPCGAYYRPFVGRIGISCLTLVLETKHWQKERGVGRGRSPPRSGPHPVDGRRLPPRNL